MAKAKTKAPDQTHEETRYLRRLSEQRSLVRIRLSNNEELEGIVEFYDESFIRLTRQGAPNVFIYKHDVKYLSEIA